MPTPPLVLETGDTERLLGHVATGLSSKATALLIILIHRGQQLRELRVLFGAFIVNFHSEIFIFFLEIKRHFDWMKL